MKTKLLTTAVLLVLGANQVSAETYTIEKWFEGKQSATVLTFDDWSPGQGPIAMPALINKGLTGSFYVTTHNKFTGGGYIQMEWGASRGLEIGNHTITHPKLSDVTATQLVNEVADAKNLIDANVPSQKGVETFVYPYGAYNQAVINEVKKKHIAARLFEDRRDYTFKYEFAQTEDDYYKIKQIQVNNTVMDTEKMAFWIDHANTHNGLMIFTFHSIGANDTWFDQISESFFNNLLDVVVSKKDTTWVTTFSKAIKYHKEAHSATLSTLSNTSSKWVLKLSDSLDDATYNQALTLRLKVPTGEVISSITQTENNIPFTVEGSEVVFNAVPDAGQLTLNKTAINSAPPICETGVDPQIIRQGEGTALWWWSDAVTTASINQGIGSINVPSGYKWLFPTETTTYTMTGQGSNGTATTCKTTVVVEGQIEQNPPVCELGADPQSIRLGEGSALWWWSDNLSSAKIDNGIGSVTTPSDYTWFFPTQTTTYTMKGVSATGVETSCKTTIVVN